MRIFKDLFSGDELAADSYKIQDIDGIAYEIEGKVIVKKDAEVDIGANPSQEEGAENETYGSDVQTVINVVDGHRLVETGFSKSDYMIHIKAYMKRIVEKLTEVNPTRVQPFQKAVQPFVKKILENFDDYKFYMGESYHEQGMIVLMFYKEDGQIPYFYLFKDGLIEEKV